MPKVKGSKQRTCEFCGHKYHSVRKKKCPVCDNLGFFTIETYYPHLMQYFNTQIRTNKEIKTRDKHSTKAVNKQVKLFRRVDIELLGDVKTVRTHETYPHDDFSDEAMLGITRGQMSMEDIISIVGETFKYGTYEPLKKKTTTDCGVVSGEQCLPNHKHLLGPNPVKTKKPKKTIPDPHGWKPSHSEFESDLTRNPVFKDKYGNEWEDYTNTQAKDWTKKFKTLKAPMVTVKGETFLLTWKGGKKTLRIRTYGTYTDKARGVSWTEPVSISSDPYFNRSNQQPKNQKTRFYSSHSCAIAKHLKKARETGAMIVNDKAQRMLELPPATYDKTETITIDTESVEGSYDVSVDNSWGLRKAEYAMKDSPFYKDPEIKDSNVEIVYKKDNWPYWRHKTSS